MSQEVLLIEQNVHIYNLIHIITFIKICLYVTFSSSFKHEYKKLANYPLGIILDGFFWGWVYRQLLLSSQNLIWNSFQVTVLPTFTNGLVFRGLESHFWGVLSVWSFYIYIYILCVHLILDIFWCNLSSKNEKCHIYIVSHLLFLFDSFCLFFCGDDFMSNFFSFYQWTKLKL